MNTLHDPDVPRPTRRTLSILASGAFLAAAASLPAYGQGGSCRQPPSSEVVLDHRLTMLWPAGSPPPTGDPMIGVYRIDSGNDRASYRFTAPEDQTVGSVWIHVRKSTLPPSGRLRVSMKEDVNGLPFPPGTIPSLGVFQPVTGWQEVPLAQTVSLTACDVYHAVIEPETPADFDATQFVELLTIVSRYPLAYQAEDPSTSEFRSFFDLELAFMYEEPPDPLLSQWIDPGLVFRPFFAIQCTDGTLFGQPYDKHNEPHILGDFVWGQTITIATAITVDHVAVFVRDEPGGDDKLQAEIHDPALPPTSNPIATTIVVENPPSATNRAHWFGGVLRDSQQQPVEITLQPGAYYLILRSVPQDGPATGFYVSMVDSTLPVPLGNLDPTYGDSTSHAIFSPDGGASFFSVPGAPDMAFILSNLEDPVDSAYGIFDEGNVFHADGKEALEASPGETLTFSMVTRNIGATTAALVYDFFDPDAAGGMGASLIGGPLQDGVETDPNRDTLSTSDARGVPLTVPTTGLNPGDRWRVLMRVGHEDFASGNFVIDDEVPWEIRIE